MTGAPASDEAEKRPSPAPEAVLDQVPTGTSLRRELAAAARSRGRESSVPDDLGRLREEIAAIGVESVDLTGARQRVAEASGEEERLKERVAALRGDVRARRAVEAETDEALGDLESAAAELSNAQTERIAAEQALERARERAARARDERERRLELEDRLRNRRREARHELAIDVYPAFRAALASVPGVDPPRAGAGPSEYEGPRLAASLAAVRIADLDAAVALGVEAARWLAERGERSPEAVLDETVVRPDRAPDP
ncbi:hypothetical protein DJ82_08875 [Halorubrum sp. Ib24]|uniref:DUF7856 family protein n=1 Tax=Halorubrum sp. Ib24 TaxID=1383850 RepID=UPI000BC816E9|nr:hypothetical protein [Halorubrum sp. Ib24]OYR39804.1 hypothetical protein DJ82_08875 [Halorubrum sp. Ib24]